MRSLKFKVSDPVGLYATPATELVNFVKQFPCHLTLKYGTKEVGEWIVDYIKKA